MTEDKKTELALTAEATPEAKSGVTENVLITNSILSFLQSEPGSKLSKDLIEFFKEWKGQSIAINKHTIFWTTVSQFLTLALVLGVALYATLNGKMDAVLAGLLGTLAGYVLGRRGS